MKRTYLLAASALFATLLAGCGGGSSGSSDSSNGSSSTGFGTQEMASSVAGPLDPIQSAVSSGISNLTGKLPAPVGDVTQCADVAVVQNLLDVGDSLLVALKGAASDPTAAYDQALTNINDSLEAAVSNLALSINILAKTNAGNECNAGTYLPLNNLVQSLPVLNQLYNTLVAQGSDPQLSSIANVIQQLDTILLEGLAQTPAAARSAPVLGGAITLLEDLATDLTPAVNSILSYNASAGNAALETLLSTVLTDALTKVVPVSNYDASAAAKIADGVDQIVTALGKITGPLLTALQTLAGDNGVLATVLNPIEALLQTLLGKL